jgi:hypothetical protein
VVAGENLDPRGKLVPGDDGHDGQGPTVPVSEQAECAAHHARGCLADGDHIHRAGDRSEPGHRSPHQALWLDRGKRRFEDLVTVAKASALGSVAHRV